MFIQERPNCYARSKYSFPSFLSPFESPFSVFPSNCIPSKLYYQRRGSSPGRLMQKKAGRRIQRVLGERKSKTSERVPPFFLTLFELRINPELLAVLIIPFLSTKLRQSRVIVSVLSRNLATSQEPIVNFLFREIVRGFGQVRGEVSKRNVYVFEICWKEDTRNEAMPHTPWFKSGM